MRPSSSLIARIAFLAACWIALVGANTNPTRGIGVTIAVVDDQAMKLLSATQVTSLQTGFATAVTGTRSVKADWENYLNNTITWSNYPKSLSTGTGIFECYVSIP